MSFVANIINKFSNDKSTDCNDQTKTEIADRQHIFWFLPLREGGRLSLRNVTAVAIIVAWFTLFLYFAVTIFTNINSETPPPHLLTEVRLYVSSIPVAIGILACLKPKRKSFSK